MQDDSLPSRGQHSSTSLFIGLRLRRLLATALLMYGSLAGVAVHAVDLGLDVATFNAVLRAQRTSGRARPYVDAILGLKLFQTQSSLVDDDCAFCDDETLDTETELDDTAFAYGIGAGLMIEFGESNVFLDTRVRYTRGRDALYLTRGSISDENLADRLRQSRTDALSIHIGVMFRLSNSK